jgi:hypothetical protein
MMVRNDSKIEDDRALVVECFVAERDRQRGGVAIRREDKATTEVLHLMALERIISGAKNPGLPAKSVSCVPGSILRLNPKSTSITLRSSSRRMFW